MAEILENLEQKFDRAEQELSRTKKENLEFEQEI
jgi:hypothetical protein